MSHYVEGQTHQLSNAFEAAGYTAEHLTKLGQSKTLLQNLLLVLDGLAEIIIKPIEKTVEEVKVYLRRLFVFKLGSTKRKYTYKTASKVFKGFFSSDFEDKGIVFSSVAPDAEIAADELVGNGKFLDFLGSTAAELEKRRLLGSQFLTICRDYPNKLRGEGFANFFVLTRNDESVAEDLSNVFVAYVFVYGDGELNAYLSRVSYDFIWNSDFRHRIFFPQQ